MNNLLSFIATALLLCCWTTSFAQSSDALRMQVFHPFGAKNCASTAFIKAAINKYGFQVFDTLRTNEAVQVTLRDKTILTISDTERKKAALAAGLQRGAIDLPKAEHDVIIQYTTLCYAVLAKYVATQRLYDCTNDDNSVAQYLPKRSFEEALRFISRTGFCSDNCHRHLGLSVVDATAPKYNLATDYTGTKGVVAHSNKHAVFVLGKDFDCYGTWKPLRIKTTSADAQFITC